MRQIGIVSDKNDAQRFSDYLLTEGITSRVDAEAEGWSVWVYEEQHVDASRAALQAFREDPSAAKYRAVAKQAERARREEKKSERQAAKNTIDFRQRWSQTGSGATPMTWTILGLMVVATLATDFGKNLPVADWLFITPPGFRVGESGYLPEIQAGQLWRLVTPIFMHGSFFHLLFGVWMFHAFGQMVERRRGSLGLLAMVLLFAVVSNVAEYFIADVKAWGDGILHPASNFLGMSGVIYGLFGYTWIQSRYVAASGFVIRQQTVFILVAWLIVCLVGLTGIANICHVAGLLAGMVLGYWPVWLRRLGL